MRAIDPVPAQVDWHDGSPFSTTFGDIYFQADSVAESQHVFLKHNRLPESWQDKLLFTIAETGFGTGLNFLLTAQTFLQTTGSKQQLQFISIEKHPLRAEDLRLALAKYPEFLQLAADLLAQYPPALPGFHRLNLANGRIQLTLIFDDVLAALGQLFYPIDAWYLDGFAPQKNPDMWHETLFTQMARLSKPKATFATFTAAGSVRRGLIAAGFIVQKIKGFGRKREMLSGHFAASTVPTSSVKKWAALPQTATPVQRVAIIGGGLAGCACAYRLLQAGYEVLLLEQESTVAAGASGNPAGLLMPQLSADYNSRDAFYTNGFWRTRQFIVNSMSLVAGKDYALQGLAQLCCLPRVAAWCQKLQAQRQLPPEVVTYLSAVEVSAHLEMTTPFPGLFYPQAGWVKPARLCQAFLSEHQAPERLQIKTDIIITGLLHNGQSWELTGEKHQTFSADAVIIATGVGIQQFPYTQAYPVYTSPGQLSQFSVCQQHPAYPVTAETYAIPLPDQSLLIGATYRKERDFLAPTLEDHQKNIQGLKQGLPELAQQLAADQAVAHIACRPTTLDHLPLVGPVADCSHFQSQFVQLAQGGNPLKAPNASYYPNLYLCSGFGSKGLSACLLSADIIAGYIQQSPLPIPLFLYNSIHTSRFWLKNLSKNIEI